MVRPFSVLVSRALFFCSTSSTLGLFNMASHLLYVILLIPQHKLDHSVFLLGILVIPCHVILFLCFSLKIGQCEWKHFRLPFEFQSAQVPINALKFCCHCDNPIKHLVNHIKLKFPILLFKCLPLHSHWKKSSNVI